MKWSNFFKRKEVKEVKPSGCWFARDSSSIRYDTGVETLKRRHRWTVEFNNSGPFFSRVTASPKAMLTSTDRLMFTFYDEYLGQEAKDLFFRVARGMYDIAQGKTTNLPEQLNITFKEYDGTGALLEEWECENCWGESLNFGCFDVHDVPEIELTTTVKGKINYTNHSHSEKEIGPLFARKWNEEDNPNK